MRRRDLLALLAGAALPWPLAARAAETELDEAVDFTGQILFVASKVPALVIGVVQNGRTSIHGFGRRAEGSDAEPDGDTLFRVGSITKAFTGQVLASLAADGVVTLADPLTKYVPDFIDPLSEAGARSGSSISPPIRRGFRGRFRMNRVRRTIPSSISPARRSSAGSRPIRCCSRRGPRSPTPISASTCSPPHYRRRRRSPIRTSSPSVSSRRSLSPTRPSRRPAIRRRASCADTISTASAMPYAPTGEVIVGSGGLYSSPRDLLRWLQWHLDRMSNEGAAERLIDHAAYLWRDGLNTVFGMDESGHMDAMGLGWVIMAPEGDRPLILQKAGGLQGIFSYVAFVPARNIGVMVAINAFDVNAGLAMAKAANDLIAELAPR